jgi:hypothetical protein
MKLLLISTSFLLLISSANANENIRNNIAQEQMRINMEKEKTYAIEQTFYQGENYDLSDSEVNQESLRFIPEQELDDLDMDDVYD